MSYRQPRKITNEEPHKKLDPREVKARASARNNKRNIDYSEEWKEEADFDSTINIDELISYDEDYDDVRNYRNNKRTDSAARRIVGKILLYLQAAISITLLIILFKLNILPDWIMVIIAGAVAVIWLIIFLTQRSNRNKGQIIGMIISLLLCIILCIPSVYLIMTNDLLMTVTTRSYDIRTYDVVVLADDPAQTLADTGRYSFGVQTSLWKENIESVIDDIEEEIGYSIVTTEMNSSLDQAAALLEGRIDAIIYNDAFTSTILEQYEDFEERTRIIKTFTVKTESEVRSIDVDINDQAFLVFISGTDTIGDVSLTGRSDVDIIAGINTKTKEILLITIPRDYYVEFPGITNYGSRDKLTHSGIYGMDELIMTVEELIDHDINYYIRMNFSSMVEIVNAMGGITIYNEQEFTSIDGYFYPQGELYLNGYFTLHYVRERHAFEDGDLARGRHQLEVMQIMMDQLISINTLANYNAITDAVAKFAVTNIPANDITDLIKLQLQENPSWHVVSYQMLGEVMYQPCQSAYNAYLSVVMPYKESIDNAEILLDQLFSGETLSEDLQLTDNGQLTYVTVPVN